MRQLPVDGMDAHSLCRMQYSVCSRKEMQEKQIAVKDHRKSLKEKKRKSGLRSNVIKLR
mgnify:FL=1